MITNKLKVRLDYILLEYLFLLGMFSGYLEHIRIWRIGIFGLLLILPLYSKKYAKAMIKDKPALLMISILILLTLISIAHSNTNKYTIYNLSLLMSSVAIVLLLLLISQGGGEVLSTFLRRKFWIINIWMGINTVVTLVQVTGYPLMIRSRWLSENPYYPDLCCGLFGGARTNALALYTCFAIVYNLLYCEHASDTKKKVIKIWTIIELLLHLYISTKNDNIALFLLLPMNLFFYYFCYGEKRLKTTAKIKKAVKIVALVLLAILILYQLPVIKDFFNEVVVTRVEKLLLFNRVEVYGSNQRFAIAKYALDNGWGWKFGIGLGVSKWRELYAFGFMNYGLSSIGTFINLMGIWTYLLLIFLYAYSCFRGVNDKFIGKTITMLIALVCTFILSIYTELFTTEVLTYWFLMWFLVYRMNDYYKRS